MKNLVRCSILSFLFLFVSSPVNLIAQKTLYVAPDGSIFGSGGIESPINSVQSALARGVSPGDTIFIRGGQYSNQATIRIDESGDEQMYLYIWAYPGEIPVFDFGGAPRGLDIRGDYLHIKGLVVENAEDNGVYLKQASYNIIEQIVSRFNKDSGVQVEDESAYNLLLNIDSHHNYDPGNNGENADGFAIKFGVGPGNIVKGCRAWGNSDDGFDFWSRDDLNQNGVLLEGNWAFRNGLNEWNDSDFRGDSNGFKLGHGPGAHTVIRNVAWGHLAHGFDVNGNTSGVTLYNNTAAFNEGTNFYFDQDQNVEQAQALLRNNLSFGDVRMDQAIIDADFNTWNDNTPLVSEVDFLSLDDAGSDGPRGPDGRLPETAFLRLAPGSQLVDAGTDVGISYSGAAPDLGAFEFGSNSTAFPDQNRYEATSVLSVQNFPNPFFSVTRLVFETTIPASVQLDVYNVLGQHVVTLLDAHIPAGRYEIPWEVSDRTLAPGMYMVLLETQENRAIHKMTLLR